MTYQTCRRICADCRERTAWPDETRILPGTVMVIDGDRCDSCWSRLVETIVPSLPANVIDSLRWSVCDDCGWSLIIAADEQDFHLTTRCPACAELALYQVPVVIGGDGEICDPIPDSQE